MNIFANTNIDFMKYRKVFIWFSAAIVLFSVFTVFFRDHLNLGIDFAGGTQLTLKFQERPEIEELRTLFVDAGISDAQIQKFGQQDDNEVLIKTSVVEGSEEGRRGQLVGVLDAEFNDDPDGSGFELNQQVVSCLLRSGPERLATLRTGLERWLIEHEYDSLAQMRGSMSLERCPDPAAYERANYIGVLQSWRARTDPFEIN